MYSSVSVRCLLAVTLLRLLDTFVKLGLVKNEKKYLYS